MKEFRADLHCHTTCSDGSLTPSQIVKLAVEKELSGLSITDHDTISAYAEAMPAAKEAGLPLIAGVEFSASHQGVGVHLLAYAFPLSSPLIHEFCQRHIERRRERNLEIISRLRKNKILIEEEDVYGAAYDSQGTRTWGRPHIAQAMVKKGYVADTSQAFQKYIGEGKCAYAAGKPFSVVETIELIHQSKGLAVLAHPMLIDRGTVVRDLLTLPFDGIEAYYSRFPLDQQQRWLDIGKKKGWLITGGSDFHGDIKPQIRLGCSWVGEDIFHRLKEHAAGNG